MNCTTNQNRLTKLVPTVFAKDFGNWFDNLFEGTAQARTAWRTPASIWEEEAAYHARVDLPGVKQEDIELTLEKGVLTITAERKTPERKPTEGYDERFYGKMIRSFSLPESIDSEAIEAKLVDGVLEVVVPKKPEAKPKKIEIKVN